MTVKRIFCHRDGDWTLGLLDLGYRYYSSRIIVTSASITTSPDVFYYLTRLEGGLWSFELGGKGVGKNVKKGNVLAWIGTGVEIDRVICAKIKRWPRKRREEARVSFLKPDGLSELPGVFALVLAQEFGSGKTS
jgi:hypothetical protein